MQTSLCFVIWTKMRYWEGLVILVGSYPCRNFEIYARSYPPPHSLIGPLSANLAYKVTRQTKCPGSKMSASTTLPQQRGLITRTIPGNPGRVQGSCVRVGGVGGKWQLYSVLLPLLPPQQALLCPVGGWQGLWELPQWLTADTKWAFHWNMKPPVLPFVSGTLAATLRPILPNTPPKTSTGSQTPTILISLTLYKDPLHKTLAMTSNIGDNLYEALSRTISSEEKLFDHRRKRRRQNELEMV